MNPSWLRRAQLAPERGDVNIADRMEVHHHHAERFVPWLAARQDRTSVLIDVDVARFVGRAWVIERIDAFLARRQCGYVWIEAAAGMGKTALAAHLVDRRGWLSHFVRRGEPSTRSRTALRNLAAQVIDTAGLRDELAPNGMPGWVQESEGFANLLALAAPRTGVEGPLVLVVDGLDEADRTAGGLPLGLPGRLPPGMFVVGTYRTGSPPGRADCPTTVITIDAADPGNVADVAEFLHRAAADEGVAGADRDRFVAQLAHLCGGVWVYLRYVLAEIHHGMRAVDKLDSLPRDLWEYYTDNLRAWREHPDWATVGAPVLAALGAAGEPVTAATLARWAGADVGAVRGWCDAVLRPFLSVVDGDAPTRYGIYHASLRELLRGEVPADVQGDAYRAWAEELRERTDAAHRRIADTYLELFGPAELADLAADPGLADTDAGYPLRQLCAHLAESGRWPDLRRLLLAGSGQNVWFAAHDAHDSIDTYLDDLDRARHHAAGCTERT
ncbi:hypothetical protein KZZ52_52520 [Dactylosporangium sp. AC04546]|uniref:AAA family ATPase n=1 Tax=Dactylosporangium sp. AC04546 TaxID=2862460 RepID=UPI001EDDE31C|nr:hypothetical protein [Dactylosporangium sp. AC04546]WVK82487.1 hypothetical protein KZZ52_52520 [Dactylosporangium sp. AC04546]